MSITLSSPDLEAQVSPAGAELVRLRDEAGRDLLWDGDPAFWTGRSPLLFPVVGRLNGDRARVDGAEYSLKQHGFARTSPFEVVEAGPGRAITILLFFSSSRPGAVPLALGRARAPAGTSAWRNTLSTSGAPR